MSKKRANRVEGYEVRLWADLEKAYEEDLRVLEESRLTKRGQEGYALICDGYLVGVFGSYEEALKNCRKSCKVRALIVKLPYREGEVVELGLPCEATYFREQLRR